MVVVVACRIIMSAPVPFPFLRTLDFEFGTWIWDLDLGLDLGLTIIMTVSVVVILEYLCFAINSHSDIHNNKEQLFILRNGMLLTEL